MAAYAATVTSLMKRAVKVDEVTGIGMYVGRCDVTNYNSTLAAITAISGKFRSILAVVAEGVSDNGYVPGWVVGSNSFKIYEGNYDAADGPLIEAQDDDDAGAFEFVAIGLI